MYYYLLTPWLEPDNMPVYLLLESDPTLTNRVKILARATGLNGTRSRKALDPDLGQCVIAFLVQVNPENPLEAARMAAKEAHWFES